MTEQLEPTPGQTVGPFFGFALPYPRGNEIVEPGTPGAVRVHGTVTDGAGQPVPDALLEIWGAAPSGEIVRTGGHLRRDGRFTGWGRAETDREGYYWFRTLEPGVTEPGAAPFYAVTLFARGLPDRLFTRAYLPGANGAFLDALGDRRRTVMCEREPDGALRFDIRMQGEGETVFLDFGGYGPRG
ncbi:protocatechuate 3,4-dioxygenase subunit alpha [Myceligenerans pegani]|uniref:Protocatechuate 3,4-dioxygenase subunit alpha n=1 Tax=Myceligenerans pegani TaxID=2776917 RepID=A0ABR9N5S1_9MICO|nr:protocatechuate 3,4-dioxygenase subunit alpha [Myceligenerans sp. TRM 65318]MBE1879012.1 protocatechuate 3,4-dioxygenase subunit alpha [Myceligenerans sp. TRM 65318]MBE3021283.1 protocatechuate 3,4-dioxygenase subunit alpha [Myceligenerans sp. TRM 65318]